MTFDPINAPVDYIILAGERSPGVAEIVDCNAPRLWDERRGYGLSGATLRFRGVSLVRFTVRIRLCEEQHFTDWNTWSTLIRRPTAESDPRRPGTPLRSPPLDISHPILDELEVSSAVIENVAAPVQTGDGEWTVEIKFIEHRPRPVIALETTTGSQTRAAANGSIEQQIETAERQLLRESAL